MDFVIDLVIIGISVGMVYALVALGISLIYSGLDIVHFAHGEIYMIGAFIGLTLFKTAGMPFVPAFLLAVILTGIVGVVIERLFYRRLTSGGGGYTVAGMGMVIAGFGMSIVLQNIAFLVWGPKPLPFPVSFGMPVEIGNLALPMSYVWIVVTALVLMFTLNLILKKTMIGLAIRAVAHNKDIAYLTGVNVPLMISMIFGIACALGGAAGDPDRADQLRAGADGHRRPDQGVRRGGGRRFRQPARRGARRPAGRRRRKPRRGFISGTYKDVYAFVLLIVVMMVKPSGILGVAAKVKA